MDNLVKINRSKDIAVSVPALVDPEAKYVQKVFLRVAKPFGKAAVTAKAQGKVIARVEVPDAVPAEMISLNI